MRPVLVCERIEIHEVADEWRVTWATGPHAGRQRFCPTAADALRRVRRYGLLLARDGVSSAIVVDWLPISRVGRMVCRALAPEGRAS